MAPQSSTTVVVRSPAKRHNTNSRTAIMKPASTKHNQPSSFHLNDFKIQKLRNSKTERSITMNQNITSTPSIAMLLSACYALDHLICTHTSAQEIQQWHNLNPWEYLSSPPLISAWKSSLETICQDFLGAKLTPDVFETKLMGLVPGIKNLEEARTKVTEDLEGELKERGVCAAVPDVFWEVMEKRVDVIAEVFDEIGRLLDEQ